VSARRAAALAAAALLAACVSGPPIEPAVVTPLKAPGVYTEILLLAPEVSSREADEKAKQLNAGLAKFLTEELQKQLGARGKAVGNGGRYSVIARLHAVYKATRVKLGEQVKYDPGWIEVQLVLQDRSRDEAAYSTLTKTRIPTALMDQWFGPGTEDLARETVRTAVADFVSRL
jgi:hypothetical protein